MTTPTEVHILRHGHQIVSVHTTPEAATEERAAYAQRSGIPGTTLTATIFQQTTIECHPLVGPPRPATIGLAMHGVPVTPVPAVCPNICHGYPLPVNAQLAHDQAGWRLDNSWKHQPCTQCGVYGWTPPAPATVNRVAP